MEDFGKCTYKKNPDAISKKELKRYLHSRINPYGKTIASLNSLQFQVIEIRMAVIEDLLFQLEAGTFDWREENGN